MFEIRRYAPALADEWNQFVAASKNGTFLFDRRYMDYHSDRFTDHSLMIYRRGKLYAVLPANVDGDTLYSHQGLTYGGLLMNERTTAAEVVDIFRLLNATLREEGIRKVVYKAVPWIYHKQPAEEDLYAFFEVCKATLAVRNLSSTIRCDSPNKWYRIRRCGARYAQKAGIQIEASEDYVAFWHVLTENLRLRYGLTPVHTIEEIELLRQRFLEHIRLFVAKEHGEVIGGTVLYVTERVVHSQYIAANARGREVHALDLLFDVVIRQSLKQYPYFDFGISTEEYGTYLNEQLIYQKEGFGGRGICYDWYEWTL